MAIESERRDLPHGTDDLGADRRIHRRDDAAVTPAGPDEESGRSGLLQEPTEAPVATAAAARGHPDRYQSPLAVSSVLRPPTLDTNVRAPPRWAPIVGARCLGTRFAHCAASRFPGSTQG